MPWAVAAAVVGAGGAIYSSNKNAQTAKKAGEAQGQGDQAAVDEQQRQFDITQKNLQPWLVGGQQALGQQQNLLGLNGTAAQQTAYNNYTLSPGQQFLRDQGMKSVMANASATGGLGGGNVLAELNKQGIGWAAQDYNNYYNQLAGVSGTGQTTGTQLGQLGANTANNIGGYLQNIGSSRASGILGGGQAQAAGMNNAIGAGMWGYNQYQNNAFGGGGSSYSPSQTGSMDEAMYNNGGSL